MRKIEKRQGKKDFFHLDNMVRNKYQITVQGSSLEKEVNVTQALLVTARYPRAD